MAVVESIGGCRLCLDPFVDSFTTIDTPQLKQKMEKVFSFAVETKDGCCSGVCQGCSYTITEFYEYSEKVRQNQETLNTIQCTLQPQQTPGLIFEVVKLEHVSVEEAPSDDESGPSLTEQLNLTCELCAATLPTFPSLRSHFVAEHNRDDPYVKCCDKRFTRRHDFLNHIKWHSDPNAFQCELCQRQYKSKDALNMHKHIKHTKELKESIRDPFRQKQQDSVEAIDDQPKQGDEASTEKNEKTLQEDQFLSKHFTFTCDLCAATAATFSNLRIHFRVEHKGTDVYVVCCKKKFNRRHMLLDHVKLHVDPNAFQCQLCLRRYKSHDALILHKQIKHKGEEPNEEQTAGIKKGTDSVVEESTVVAKVDRMEQSTEKTPKRNGIRNREDQFIGNHIRLTCEQCNETKPTFHELRNHFRTTHSSNNAYVMCCNEKFSSRGLLIDHLKGHESANSSEAEFYGMEENGTDDSSKQFNQPLATSNKIRVKHKKIKLANESESTKKELCNDQSGKKKSMRDHDDQFISQQIKLTCELCNVTKSTFAELRSHFRGAHGSNKPYVTCCNMKISKRSRLIHHLKRHSLSNTFKSEPVERVEEDLQEKVVTSNQSNQEVTSEDSSEEEARMPGRKRLKADQDDTFLSKHFSFTCEICGTTESTFKQLSNHFRANHAGQDPYVQCCGKMFTRRYDLVSHVRLHVDPNAFQCVYCQSQYKCKDSLILHKQTKHADKLQQEMEEALRAKTKRKAEKQEHRSVDDNFLSKHFTLNCELCGVTEPTFTELRNHFWTEHNLHDGYVTCCETKFYKRCHIVEHAKLHLNPEILSAYKLHCPSAEDKHVYKCDQCPQSFEQKCMLVTHMEQHKVIECTQCSKRFSSKVVLDTHLAKVHGAVMDRIFVCEHCGNRFTKTGLKRHIEAVHKGTEASRVQCSVCDRWLKPHNYKYHMQYVHGTSDQQYECDICHKQYPHLLSLQSHKKQAHAEAKFECEFCGKKFKQRLGWQEHRTTHTGEILYSCEYCGTPYKGKSSMYMHIKKKHPAEWSAKRLQLWQGGVKP